MNSIEKQFSLECGSSTGQFPQSSLDIQQYLSDLEPKSILELIDQSVLCEMVRALNYRFRKGSVLLYATKESDQKGGKSWSVLKHNEINSAKADLIAGYTREMEFFNPFCRKLAETVGRGNCECSDCRLAQMFVDDSNRKPELLECWLGLKEPCAPIRIAGQTRALLIGGGQIVESIEHESSIVAQLHALNACGQLHEDGSTRITDEQLEELEKNLKHDTQESPTSTLKRVSEVADALQTIVDRAFSVRRREANHRLMVRLAQGLVSGDWGDSESWWQNAGVLFQEMRQILEVTEIVIYTRFGSLFERTWASNPATTTTARLATREIVSNYEADTFILLDRHKPQHRELLGSLNSSEATTVHMLHTDHKTPKAHYGTLILLIGKLSTQHRDLAETFCQEVGLRLSIVSLLFHIQDKDAAFRERVFEIAHSFRTPLQALICDLGEALQIPPIKEDGSMSERLEQSLDLLYDARSDVNLLLEEAKPVDTTIDLASLLSQIFLDFKVLAEKKNCEVVKRGSWPTGILLIGDHSKLRRAFLNLMDNAIKYSWRNRYVALDFHLTEAGDARVIIENYGMGVPPEDQDAIFTLGVRLNLSDSNAVVRHGAGMGLTHTMRIIEHFGGGISLTSHPRLGKSPDPKNPYHNWITRVIVTLPIKQP